MNHAPDRNAKNQRAGETDGKDIPSWRCSTQRRGYRSNDMTPSYYSHRRREAEAIRDAEIERAEQDYEERIKAIEAEEDAERSAVDDMDDGK